MVGVLLADEGEKRVRLRLRWVFTHRILTRIRHPVRVPIPPASSSKRPRWPVIVVSVAVSLAIAGGGIAVAAWVSGDSPHEFAASTTAEGLSSTDGTVAPTTPVTVALPKLSDYVSPDQQSAVGISVMTFTDLTRSTPARGDRETLTTRPLTVTVRYPTAGMPSEEEIPDAPAYAPAPLILFAHGFDSSSQRYSSLLHDLAASGFVVAAPEFPMSSTVFDGAPDEYEIPEQTRDLSFLITAMTGSDAPPVLAAMIAPGPVGLVGHSDGAVTALLAGYAPRFADSRVAAVAAISGDFDTFGGEWFTTSDPPLLAIHGEFDEINPFESSETLVENDPGPAMLVMVQGASHLGSAIDPETEPAVARLIAFDFLWRLTGSTDSMMQTQAAASTSPLELVSRHD